jgi:glycosyltransferase involved in cell wall biosynthesis
MNVLIASSGFGVVSRGIETWSIDLATALSGRVDIRLAGCKVIPGMAASVPFVPLGHVDRHSAWLRWLSRLAPGFTWRWGMKSPYAMEQKLCYQRLAPYLKSAFILHSQDPFLALQCLYSQHRSRHPQAVVLAHGTEEPYAFLNQFDFIQHLAPWHLEQALAYRAELGLDVEPAGWTAIPNFVDCETFKPDDGQAKRAICERFSLSPETIIVGCAAAVKSTHKRLDYLLREFQACLTSSTGQHYFLYIAGARTNESSIIENLAKNLPVGSYAIDYDLPREKMSSFYQSLDLFVLSSLYEMMPIALLEALSSGLPVLVNNHPVLAWMTGNKDSQIDMSQKGCLASRLLSESRQSREQRGLDARRHVRTHFDKHIVVDQIVDYYHRVMEMSHD